MQLGKRFLPATALVLALCSATFLSAQTFEPAQIRGDSEATSEGWQVNPLITVGETKVWGAGFRPGVNTLDVNDKKFGYRPPGILDGIAAFPVDFRTVRLLVNHELTSDAGYPYALANGTMLTGARVSYFDINRQSRRVVGIGPAFDTVYDRPGNEVTDPEQVGGGLNRLCSSFGVEAGQGGLENNIYFTGEETDGGTEYVLDVDNHALYAAPMMGVAAWENVCPIENFDSDRVAIVIGDDRGGAPLLLYIGEKGASPAEGYAPPEFLVRNGLGMGVLLTWVANDPAITTPEEFNGTGSSLSGTFVKIAHYDPSQAGVVVDEEGELAYDELGFVNQALQDALSFGYVVVEEPEEGEEEGEETVIVEGAGAFKFSRPEDVSPNPDDLTQVVLASTGRGSLFPADDWGQILIIDFDDEALSGALAGDLANIDGIPAEISILYDGDDAGGGQFAGPDFGIRSPDNLDWADDGYIYINEDRSTDLFGVGGVERDEDVVVGSGVEASVWQLDPESGKATRILEIDRGAIPAGQADPEPFDIGNWESSGVLDVTSLFPTKRGETLLILDVQGHSLCGGGLAFVNDQDNDLVQGGQLLFASKAKSSRHYRDDDDKYDDDDDRRKRSGRSRD